MFLWILLICFAEASGQFSPLSQFSGFQQGSSVQLSFTIKGGNTCLGTDIERSSDSIHFEKIGSIAGICGSSDQDESYAFTDAAPLANEVNYYRLLLGQLGYSTVIGVSYLDYKNGLLIFPNPVTVNSTCYFPNDNRDLVVLRIHDAKGTMHFFVATREDQVAIASKKLSTGIYLVTLEQDGVIRYQSKMVVP